MGKFYFHDGAVLLAEGCCPDGMEEAQIPPQPGAILVLGEPPIALSTLAIDQQWCMRRNKIIPRIKADAVQWAEVRYRRDQLLAATDWRELRAYREGRALESKWLVYRQALRDVTQQPNPEAIDWPAEPSG